MIAFLGPSPLPALHCSFWRQCLGFLETAVGQIALHLIGAASCCRPGLSAKHCAEAPRARDFHLPRVKREEELLRQ